MKRLMILVLLLFTISSVNLFSQEKFIDILMSISCTERKINLESLITPSDSGLNLSQINQDFRLDEKLYILKNNPTDSINLFCILSIETDSIGFEKLRLSSKRYFLIDKVNQKCFSFYIPNEQAFSYLETDTITGGIYLRCGDKISRGISNISEYSIQPPYDITMEIRYKSFIVHSSQRGKPFLLFIYNNEENEVSVRSIYSPEVSNFYEMSYKELLDLRDSFNK